MGIHAVAVETQRRCPPIGQPDELRFGPLDPLLLAQRQVLNDQRAGAVIGGAPHGAGVLAPRSIVPGTVKEVGAVSDEIRFGARVDVQLFFPIAIHIVTRGTTVSSLAGVNGAVVARCENRSARERVPPGIAGIPKHPTG